MAESFSERAQSGDAAGWQCGGCDLQAIEQQAGGFGVHLAADNHAHDLPGVTWMELASSSTGKSNVLVT